ncbi:MAG: hypothetical protein ABIP51_18140 [Bacteroidia bacterium]
MLPEPAEGSNNERPSVKAAFSINFVATATEVSRIVFVIENSSSLPIFPLSGFTKSLGRSFDTNELFILF